MAIFALRAAPEAVLAWRDAVDLVVGVGAGGLAAALDAGGVPAAAAEPVDLDCPELPQAASSAASTSRRDAPRLTNSSIEADRAARTWDGMVRSAGRHPSKRLLEYDALRRRVWILGQRCHHGATGSIVASVACMSLVLGPAGDARQPGGPRSMLALAAAGGALMIHDWKDRSVWFERGAG